MLHLFSGVSPAQDMRAAWLVRYNWRTEDQVDKILSKAVSNRITDIFVQIRGRGDAYYKNAYEPLAIKFANNSPDPLKMFISKARQLNIRIHAWVNVFLVGSTNGKPYPRNHILSLHPDWVLHDKEGKSLLDYQPKEFTSDMLEGVFLNPLLDDVLDYHFKLIKHIIKNYRFDGIHLDYFRLPTDRTYDPDQISPIKVSEKLGFFLLRVRKTIKKFRINSVLSVAVKSDLLTARNEYGQDWADWLNKKYIDYTIAMNYTNDDSLFINRLKNIPESLRTKVVMGISLYDKPENQAHNQSKFAIKYGYPKLSFFSLKYLK